MRRGGGPPTSRLTGALARTRSVNFKGRAAAAAAAGTAPSAGLGLGLGLGLGGVHGAAGAAGSGAAVGAAGGGGAAGPYLLEIDCGAYVLTLNAGSEANRALWSRELCAWADARKRVVDASLMGSGGSMAGAAAPGGGSGSN